MSRVSAVFKTCVKAMQDGVLIERKSLRDNEMLEDVIAFSKPIVLTAIPWVR